MPHRDANYRSILRTSIVFVALVAVAAVGMHFLQRSVKILPGTDGCWRLEGTTAQTSCLADEFQSGALRAAAHTNSETTRAAAIAAYVRSSDRRAASDQRLAGLCHPAMHQLGRSEGRRAAGADTVPSFPAQPNGLCTAGYVHGLAEGYLSDAGPRPAIATIFPHLCADARSRSGCAHGIGHALIRARSGAMMTTGARQSTTLCMRLPRAYTVACMSGVYMELAMRTQPRTSPREFTRLCAALTSPDERDACTPYISLSVATNDLPVTRTAALCASLDTEGALFCMRGFGRQIGLQSVYQCNVATTATYAHFCIDGAVSIPVGSGHTSAAAARKQCARLSRHEYERYCNDAAERYEAGSRQRDSVA